MSKREAAVRTAELAKRLLGGDAPAQPLTELQGMSEPAYDARELARWHIAESRLPRPSSIQFGPPTLWQQYRAWVAAALAVLGLQSAMLAALLLQRARRRRAEDEARQLSGRILTAHEDERRRLARLAIEASRTPVRVGSRGTGTLSMHDDPVRLSEDVHAFSYRPHPTVLDDLGLVDALQSERDRVAEGQRLPVALDAGSLPQKLPTETAVCLFRIAQQASRNIVRHARTCSVAVSLASYQGQRHHLVPAARRRQWRVLHGRAHPMTMTRGLAAAPMPRRGWRIAAVARALTVPLLGPLRAQPAVDAEAERLLKASMAYVGQLGRLSIRGRTMLEVVLKSGQKIQLDSTPEGTVQRPDRMRVRRGSRPDEQVLVYDGRTLTLWSPARIEYAPLPAPGSIDKALDVARDRLGVVAPIADVIAADAYAAMMDGVSSGFVVGAHLIEGVNCDHLAFRAPHVDWQIWIERGARPLPRKMVITTRELPNEPQFEVVITQWDLQPRIGRKTFDFAPPKGARQIELAPPEAPAPGK